MMITTPLGFAANLAGMFYASSRANAKWGLALSGVTLLLLAALVC